MVASLAFSACGKKTSEFVEDPALRGLTLGPVFADTALRYLQPESAAVGLGEYDVAHKTAGRSEFWLVDYTWFFLPRRPLQFKTFAEMHKMEEDGKIDTATVVSVITYRYGIEAEDIEHLRAGQRLRRPCPAKFCALAAAKLTLAPRGGHQHLGLLFRAGFARADQPVAFADEQIGRAHV